jgi:heme oxygenase (biliverdin-producing, ferredoxin)
MLSTLVREASKESHYSAENSPFMVALLRGELEREAYCNYLAQLAPIYETLESWTTTKLPLFDRRLDRFERIISDIDSMCGMQLVLNETIEYTKHLKSIIESGDEIRFLAHHYVRYLGDLSGGQAVAKLVMRNMSIPPNFLSFYEFDQIQDKVRYKETYRDNLDNLELTEEQTQSFISEVMTAFEHHSKIFDALESKWLA